MKSIYNFFSLYGTLFLLLATTNISSAQWGGTWEAGTAEPQIRYNIIEILESDGTCTNYVSWKSSTDVYSYQFSIIALYKSGKDTYQYIMDQRFYYSFNTSGVLSYNMNTILESLEQNSNLLFFPVVVINGFDQNGNPPNELLPCVIPIEFCNDGIELQKGPKLEVPILEAIAQVIPPDFLVSCRCDQFPIGSLPYFNCMAECGHSGFAGKTAPNEQSITPNKPSLSIAPNPVNTSTIIDFQLTTDATTHLSIYDINGQKISSIISEQALTSGSYQETLDCEHLAPGIYLLELIVGQDRRIEKLIKY